MRIFCGIDFQQEGGRVGLQLKIAFIINPSAD